MASYNGLFMNNRVVVHCSSVSMPALIRNEESGTQTAHIKFGLIDLMRTCAMNRLMGRQLASPNTKRVSLNGIPWILGNPTSHRKRATDTVVSQPLVPFEREAYL
jgi:hypothetical protein